MKSFVSIGLVAILLCAPTDGVAQVVTRFKWAAMFIAWVDGLDYALEGEGWCDSR